MMRLYLPSLCGINRLPVYLLLLHNGENIIDCCSFPRPIGANYSGTDAPTNARRPARSVPDAYEDQRFQSADAVPPARLPPAK